MTRAADRVAAAVTLWSGPGTNAAWLLCDRHPADAVALTVVAGDTRTDTTFGELREWSQRCAAGLRELGVGRGDRVATLMGKGVELVGVMLAAWRLGAVYVPLFTAFAPAEARTRLRRSGAAVVVVDAEHLPADPGTLVPPGCRLVVAGADLDSLLDRPADGTAPVAVGGDGPFTHLFTSGTTGAPKGVVHPVAFVAGWDTYLEYALGVRPDGVYWCAADPGWGFGLYAAVVGPLSAGMRTVLVRGGFDVATTWRVLADLRVTDFVAAPTVFRAMRVAPTPVPDGLVLTRISSAGEPVTAEIDEWAREVLGTGIHDHFGQTEIGMPLAEHHHPDLARPRRPGTTGVESPGWRLAVLRQDEDVPAPAGEVGRLAVDRTASPLMTFDGYQDGAGADRVTADGRWYLTGDAASRDATGVFAFSGRADDVIIAAGYRIGPFDVESVLARHPAVAECAVVAGPDPVRGEVVEAFVVPRGPVPDPAALTAELQQLVRTGYAAHAYPRRVHLRDALPKTPSGKVQRFALRAELRAERRTTL